MQWQPWTAYIPCTKLITENAEYWQVWCVTTAVGNQPNINLQGKAIAVKDPVKILGCWLSTSPSSDASILKNVTKLWRAFFAYGSIGSYTGELSPPSSHQYYWRMCDANPSIWCRKLGWILLGRTWKESSKAVKVCCKWGSPPCFTLTHYEGKNLVPCAESWVSRDKLELKEYPICQHLTFPRHRTYTERVPHPAVPQVGNLPWHKLLHAHLWSHP